MKVFSLLLIVTVSISCRMPQVTAQELLAYRNTPIPITSNTDGLKGISLDEMHLLDTIESQKKEIHLLRTEIDMLKKTIRAMNINTKIDQLQDDFNKITKE